MLVNHVVRLFCCLVLFQATGSLVVGANDGVRFATFNASMSRNFSGDLVNELANPGSAQPATIAEIIQRTNPDVVLINEFDYDDAGAAAASFQSNYLGISQNGAAPVVYPHVYIAPSNTGIPSGFDLDNNGIIGTGVFGSGDALGFGRFPGQFGMVLYSKHPILTSEVRTFQNFLWKDMPGALLPGDPDGVSPDNPDWYSPAELDVLPLSSKSHWDVPLSIGGQKVHVLASHPTPPVFDGAEDRNGRRNSDEIRFWSDYITPGSTSDYIYDDMQAFGGLGADEKFVIMGDLNSDPFDGDSLPGSIGQLLDNPLVNTSVTPTSLGGPEDSAAEGLANLSHLGDPAFDTADFNPANPGNIRADYVLPSANLLIDDAGVFWPVQSDPLSSLTGNFPFPGSDHRLVYVDIVIVPEPSTLTLAGLLVGIVPTLTRRRNRMTI